MMKPEFIEAQMDAALVSAQAITDLLPEVAAEDKAHAKQYAVELWVRAATLAEVLGRMPELKVARYRLGKLLLEKVD